MSTNSEFPKQLLQNAGSEEELRFNNISNQKKRFSKHVKTDFEAIQLFWMASLEAYFNQGVIALITGRSVKTLECYRWKKSDIPFRKVGGRVLYQKKDVIEWLENHQLVTSTSAYSREVSNG
jgi:hypothetical protein